MEITWYGHSCFRLAERSKASVVTDPFDDHLGLAVPKLRAEIVTISHLARGHSYVEGVRGVQRVIHGAGEYEIGGVFITGVAMHNTARKPPKPNIAYVFDFDGLRVAHLGDLDHIPPQTVIEALESVHVALVPVGGGGLNATQAVEVISLLEPNYVIPMHYQLPNSTLALDPLECFLREMGVSRVQQEQVFRVSVSNLPEQTQVVVMEQSTRCKSE
ncbi:MAG: MBL fold metallo-hydrolase [Chloroflexi bacterium]|nr:MBL fold metallo-hydrolase [Chloroflexota bacterium]